MDLNPALDATGFRDALCDDVTVAATVYLILRQIGDVWNYSSI